MTSPSISLGKVAELWIYPIKSCAGIRVAKARLLPTGLAWDRHWMVVDDKGRFVTQRTHPHMALLATELTDRQLLVQATHQDALPVLRIDLQPPRSQPAGERLGAGAALPVRVWASELPALDEGDAVAQWFSQALGDSVRLVRFDPEVQRPCAPEWTGEVAAHTEFADGFPLLITTDTSVDALNTRLQASGDSPVDMRRFRANVVLSGFAAHAEDGMAQLDFLHEAGAAQPVASLRPVKPCTRCPMPDVNPETAEQGSSVRAALKAYRRDPAMKQAITFGQNAIVLAGAGELLRAGMAVQAVWA